MRYRFHEKVDSFRKSIGGTPSVQRFVYPGGFIGAAVADYGAGRKPGGDAADRGWFGAVYHWGFGLSDSFFREYIQKESKIR